MPTMKEIAEWLRRAGRNAEQTMPFANEPWEEMAKQVEQMRGKNCAYRDDNYFCTNPKITEKYKECSDDADALVYCYPEDGGHYCGNEFYCIHHKFKEVENG